MALAHTEKAAAVAQAKRMIAPVDKKTEGLAERAQQSGAGAKVAYRENMKELAAKTEEAEGHQARPESSTSQPRDATKEGFSKACQDLHQACEKATAAAK